MSTFFQFEADFIESLRCIPMQVRFKLDTCGIKLKLNQWNQLNQVERQKLVEIPCQTPTEIEDYREFLQSLIQTRTGNSATEFAIAQSPAWLNATTVPIEVQAKAKELGATISAAQWAELTALQRFALIKLSRSSHENSNFLPALREFERR